MIDIKNLQQIAIRFKQLNYINAIGTHMNTVYSVCLSVSLKVKSCLAINKTREHNELDGYKWLSDVRGSKK